MPLAGVSAVDGFAMAMVVILTLGLGVVALLVVSISRNGKRRDHAVEQLIDELRRDEAAEKQPAPSAAPEPREAWEKDGDWWKH